MFLRGLTTVVDFVVVDIVAVAVIAVAVVVVVVALLAETDHKILSCSVVTTDLGKGSKIKLIIFAEFSAKGVPPHPPFAENN